MLALALAQAAFSVALVDELEPLYPDSTTSAVGKGSYTIDVPRGSIAGVHILLNGLQKEQPLQVKSSQPGGWFRLIDVPVEVNTGVESRTERIDGKVNPDVIRRAPFRVFDAIEPVQTTITPTSPTLGLRFEMAVPTGAEPGAKSVRLTFLQGETRRSVVLRVRIHEAVVPPVGKDTLGFTNWWSSGNLAKYHEVEAWSEPFWTVLGRYADLMARARQNTVLVPWGEFTRRDGDNFTIDRAKLRRFVRLFEERGIVWLEGGHLAGRENGDWMAKRFTLNLTGEPVNSPKGKQHLQAICSALDDAIRAEGWQKRWLQHIADEPIGENAKDYAEIASQVRILMPLIPIFEATMSRNLVGAVQGWCPQVHEMEEAKEWFAERQKAGDLVWAYTCLSPTGPWMNRLIDMERLRPALIPWAMVRHDLDGFLHWGFNFWHGDPFNQSVVPHGDHDNPATFLPAGDTHVAYPKGQAIWSSTRLEAHRIGFEDAELLRLLKRRAPAAYESVTGPVARGFRDYTKSVAVYRRGRKALLEAVAALSRPR